MKRYLVPVVAGVTVFGAATAFAASLTVNSTSLGSGNATVASCNASATVAYAPSGPVYSVTPYGYKVAVVPITSAVACATRSYKVTLTGTGNASLAERSGTLDSSGNANPDFTSENIEASAVTGASIVITG
ncbi:MAG: hypothetical protein M3N47_12035 [Chloroflexota bacterium]|nr:hypothetical protein [Chloroflexota bacterium]